MQEHFDYKTWPSKINFLCGGRMICGSQVIQYKNSSIILERQIKPGIYYFAYDICIIAFRLTNTTEGTTA